MFQRFHHRAGHYLMLLTVAAGLFLVNLGAPSLWDIDEGHNAEAAREMLASGNWIVPTFNFQLRSDKPALLYWLQMGAYRLFGINEFAARFPSALAAMATILLTYELGRRLFGAATGLLAGFILASTVQFCAAGHFANPDALLLAFSTLTLFLFSDSYIRGGRSWFVPASISAGLAVLAKGPVGLVLPLTVTVLFLFWSRRLRILLDRRLLWGALAFVLVAAPWYGWVSAETKFVFAREFFLVHNTGRFQAAMEGHGGPAYYYLLCLMLGFAPWSIFLGPALWFGLGSAARRDRLPTEEGATSQRDLGLPVAYRLLWCWIGVYAVFFSTSATKLPNYILPIYPPMALLTAQLLERWRRGAIAIPSWIMRVSLACLVLLGLGFALGMAFAGGLLAAPFVRGRVFPGLEAWAVLGVVPLAGAVGAWWLGRRHLRLGFILSVGATAVCFTGALAAWGSEAVDRFKSTRPLVDALQAHRTEREIRVGLYRYYQPSLVFYSRHEVNRLFDEAQVLEFLRYPLPVYLFVPAPVWNALEPRVRCSHQVVGRHPDLYQGCEVLVVTNQLEQ